MRPIRLVLAIGLIAVGIGAAVLGRQFGWFQLSYISVAIIVIIASSLGFFLAGLLNSARRQRRRSRDAEAHDDTPAPTPERTAASASVRSAEVPRRAPEPMPSAAPYWCYVLADTDVLDLRDHTRVVGHLKPGNWYLAKREVGPWLHVATGENTEGWVARTSVHR
jgi:hypothetical protein